MSKKLRASLILLLTAIVWGAAFSFQKEGGVIGSFTFNGIRLFIGGLSLIPVILIMNIGKGPLFGPEKREENKATLIGGICVGLALFVATNVQQFGLAYTTAGKAAFITTLYVAIVPILNLIRGKKVRPIMWLCVALGCVGLYLIAMTDSSFKLQIGDLLMLICALGFACHILTVDHFTAKVDGLKLSCVQFLTAGILGIICMFIFESPVSGAEIVKSWVSILYTGIISAGVGYTLQIIGQKDADPAVASLILCLESVFGAIFGVILLHETMTQREVLGCVVIFAAVIISNLPERKKLN